MKNRIELAKYFAYLGFKKGAEIGASFGYYSEILCKNIPGLELLAVDNWNNGMNSAREKINNVSGEETTRKRLSAYNATVIKKDSLEAVKDISDEALDFVFIDAEHSYKAVKEDIEAWDKKVRKGGIVSGHDYYIFKSGNKGVIDAVNEHVKKYSYKLELTDWDRNNPVRDDRQPSWFYIKT